jgi:hypothetical protein
MTPTTNYPQIIDGFCYSGLFGTRPLNGMSWYWSCLSNLENLRLAADSYSPRWWVVPKNFLDSNNAGSVNILPGKTVFYEFEVPRGSWLYGLQFAVFEDELGQDKFSVVIRQGSDLPFFDRVMTASGIAAETPTDPFNTLFPPVNLLPEPRLIVSPTQLHVEVSNDQPLDSDSTGASVQLLMLFAEPK